MHGAEHGLVLLHAGQQRGQPDGIGVEHRAATITREAIAHAPHHVDIAGTLRDALVQYADALVQQGKEAALEDFPVGMRSRADGEFCGTPREYRDRFGIIMARAITLLVAVEAL